MEKIIQQRPLRTFEKLHDNPLLNRLFQARGIRSTQELDRSFNYLLNPNQLKNIEQAVELLIQAYHAQERVIIVGDFDADGATSTALALIALRQFGFAHVDYLIPDRFTQGYGLSLNVAEMVIEKGADLVVTVDNGTSSFEGIAHLKAAGIKVLVTDHHLPPACDLPNADAIVNPNLNDCSFPSKSLAGVGVTFYTMTALRARLRALNVFQGKEPNLAELLDLVALGTVADVVPLDHNNRILIHHGLERIRHNVCRVGISALAEVAKRDLSRLKASDLGFAIAPRLNAAGRLENMSLGVELLTTNNPQLARQLALELDSLNQARKEFESDMKTEALAICAKLPSLMQKEQAHGIALYQPDWHQGVIGILASRIKDQFHRPVIAFAQESDESNYIKGSARSIEGLHMRDLLERIDQKQPNLLVKFGGHAMAAGLTIHQKDFNLFQKLFDETIAEMVNLDQLQGVVWTDGELSAQEFTLETAQLLQQAGPWGQHFPEPVFEGEFAIVQQRLLGGKHLKMLVEIHNKLFDAIMFNADLRRFPDLSLKRAKMIFSLDINEFRGQTSLQLLVNMIAI